MQETQEMWAQSLDWEDALEEEMAAHSSILAWSIPQTEEPGGLESGTAEQLGKKHTRQHLHKQDNVIYGV